MRGARIRWPPSGESPPVSGVLVILSRGGTGHMVSGDVDSTSDRFDHVVGDHVGSIELVSLWNVRQMSHGHEILAAAQPCLPQQPLDVRLHSVRGDVERLGELGVG